MIIVLKTNIQKPNLNKKNKLNLFNKLLLIRILVINDY